MPSYEVLWYWFHYAGIRCLKTSLGGTPKKTLELFWVHEELYF